MKKVLVLMVCLAVMAGSVQAAVIAEYDFSDLTPGTTIATGSAVTDQSGTGAATYNGVDGPYSVVSTTTGTAIDNSGNDDGALKATGFTLSGTGNFTLEAVVNWNNTTQSINGLFGQISVVNQNSSNQVWMRENGGNLQYVFGIENGVGTQHLGSDYSIGTAKTDGAFHHIGVVYDGTAAEIRFYLDGVLLGTDTDTDIGSSAAELIDSTAGFELGAYNTATNRDSNGIQSVYRVSDEALDPSEFWPAVPVSSTASAPDPDKGESLVEVDLLARDVAGKLSWTAPTAYEGATYDIYFGTTEPNDLFADYGLTQIGTAGQADTSVAPALPLTNITEYHWVVDAREPNVAALLGYDLHRGGFWSFTTISAEPFIDTHPVGDVGASVDLLVEGTSVEVYEWYRAGDPNVLVQTTGTLGVPGDPNNTYTASTEGYYYCVVSNGAGTLQSDTVLVMNPRLYAHWTLDTDGTDSSGNGYHGTIGSLNAPTAGVGIISGALDFDDAQDDPNDPNTLGDWIDLTAHVDDFAKLEQGTITAWVKTTDGMGVILSAYDSTVGSSEGRFFAEGAIRWDVRDDGGNPNGEDGMIVGSTVSDDEWHLVAITVGDAQAATLYVDGLVVAAGTEPFWGQMVGVLDGMAIGRNVDSGTTLAGQWHLNGLLDDLRIYTNPLIASEVADMYLAADPSFVICSDDPAISLIYDFNDDCIVDLADFAAVAGDWLNCSFYPDCTTYLP